MDLRGKACVLTGCGSGIGKHMMGVLHAAGARVFATDVAEGPLAEAVTALGGPSENLRTQVLDVRDAAQWESVLHNAHGAFGRVDILLNIAGISHSAYIHEADPVWLAHHVDINLKGVMFGTHYAAKIMVAQRAGHIVNIASLAGLCPVPGMSAYSASKFGVRGFSISVADELRAHNVFVTAICPDAVATPMLDHEALEPEAALSFSGNRILTVQDVEHAILHGALGKRKQEVILPRSMAGLARLVTAWPSALMPLLPLFRARGQKNQAAYRAALQKAGTGKKA